MTEDEAVQWVAEKMVEASDNIPDFSTSEEGLGDTWAFTQYTTTRDDRTINVDRVFESFEKRHPGDSKVVRCRHWACGWIDHFMVRMLDEDGTVTKAGREIVDRLRALKVGRDGSFLSLAREVETLEGRLKKPRHAVAVE